MQINCENLQSTKVFQMLTQGDWIECFNGEKEYLKEKDAEKHFITLENGYSCHVLNVKNIVRV